MKCDIRLKIKQIMLEALQPFCELKKISDPAQMRNHPQCFFTWIHDRTGPLETFNLKCFLKGIKQQHQGLWVLACGRMAGYNIHMIIPIKQPC